MNTLSPVGVPGFEPAPRPYPLSAARGPIAAPRGLPRSASRTMPPLAIGRIAKDVTLMTLLMLLNMFGNAGAAIFFGILVVMCFYSSSAAFKALAIMWLGLMTNTAFVPKSLTWTPCRLALPYLCLIRFSWDMAQSRSSLMTQPFYLAFLAYCMLMALCSVMSGWFTTIALFKLANFWAAFSAIFAGGFVLVRKKIDIGEWVVSLITVSTLIACLAIATGKWAISFGGAASTHFGGAFLHPNCHSSYASSFVIFLVSVFTFSPYKRLRLLWVLIAIWAVFIAWSRSRSAVVATVLGLTTLVPFISVAVRPTGWIRRVNVSRTTILIGGLLALMLLFTADLSSGNRITSALVAFFNKSAKVEDQPQMSLDISSVTYSRSGHIERGLDNFRENPVFGIGFQVAKNEWFARNATIFTAPVEKGFLPTAVLEEGGIVGTTGFVVFILTLAMTFLLQRNVPALAMFFSFLGATMTEVSIFAPGGSGGFAWVMVAAAYVLGETCWVRRQQPINPRSAGHLDAARPATSRYRDQPSGLPAVG